MEIKINETLLEECLSKVEQARTWSPRLISKLENTIRSAEDEDLFRLNPIQWAHAKNIDENEAIDLLLHSAKVGLFYMDWNVICPCCGMIMKSLRNLHGIRSENVCTVCFRKDRATLDDYVQVTFTLSPSVRLLRFHHPESLPLEDYCFKYLFERGARMLGGTMSVSEFLTTYKTHFSAFSPGERITVETEVLKPGVMYCNEVYSQKTIAFMINGEPAAKPQTLKIKLTGERFEVPLPEIRPGEFHLGRKTIQSDFFYALHPGKIVLEFEQATTSKGALVVWGADAETAATVPDAQFAPSLTAKRLFTNQTFHDLFRSEVFQESEGFGVKDVTILFTDLKGSTQLYNRIGDLNAFALVREHYGVLSKAILNQHGAVVKTIGDAIMATFTCPEAALEAGLVMLQELRQLNKTSQYGDLILKVGIHKGAAISVNLNERIDYFGQTVNLASRVQGMAGGDEIYLTDDIYSSAGVPELLQQSHSKVEPLQIELKGIEGAVNVYKVTCPN